MTRFKIPHPAALFALAASLFLTAPRLQAQSIDKESERTAQALEHERQASQAARQAAERAASAAGAGVLSYDQVLANPDDVELNYRYAKQQVERGDLKGAAATLERILLVNPALPKVRLFYAIVLYRLDILPESLRELMDIRDMPGVPEELRAEIQRYLDLIRRRLRRTNVSTRLSLGFQYDTNRNAAPDSGQQLFAGQPVQLASGLKTDDSSLISMARAALAHDLGAQAGHNLFADFDVYRADQNKLHALDFSAYSWRLGGTFKRLRSSIAPSAVFNYATLGNRTYLRTRGAAVDFARTLGDRVGLALGFSNVFQEFIPNASAPTADERTGYETDVSLALDYLLNPSNRLTLGFIHTDKDARRQYQAFQRETFRLTHAWVLGKGLFLLTNGSLNLDAYAAPELAVYSSKRYDVLTRLSATLGVPLSLAHPVLKDLLGTLSYEYLVSNSNILSYDYHDHKVNAMLTYRWDL